MNRRNFILGLGTAATLSGAASVTGASLQDTVNPEADFRVIAAEELIVIDNPALDESGDANYTTVEPSSFDHNNTAASSGTNLSVNDGEDDGLSLALASGNNPDDPTTNFTGGEAPYVNESVSGGAGDGEVTLNSSSGDGVSLPVASNAEAPIAIENNTGSSQPVAIQYDTNDASYGDAINNGVSPSELETLFQFFIYDGTDYQQISPDGSGSDTPYSYVDVGAGKTELVHLVINLTDSISQSIQDAASTSGGGFSSSATDDVDLLDTAAFGVN